MKYRTSVNKGVSAKQFRGNVSRTHPKNIRVMPMRGGYRL